MNYHQKSKKISKLIYPVVVLILIILLSFAATYSWLNNQKKASMTSTDKYITIDADSGLEMNYGTEDMNQGTININQIFNVEKYQLHECTTTDGRNFFFPLSQYSSKSDGDKEFVDDADTLDFRYRPATANDKNTKYISVDLTLSSKEAVPIYLHSATRFGILDEIKDQTTSTKIANAIRVSFVENEPNGKTVIFDNSEQGYAETIDNTVASVTSTGLINAKANAPCNSVGSYKFGNQYGNVLFNLEAGIEKKITVNIWLEGADKDCTSDITTADIDDLYIFIKFTTTKEDTIRYTLVDHTLESWVQHEDTYVYAIDENGNKEPMTPTSKTTWVVDLVESFVPVKFARYNPELQENTPQSWNVWDAGDPGSCRTYNAYAHNTGIWDNNFSGTTITFYDAMLDHPTVSQTDKAFMYVKYDAVDGNGNTLNIEHKMSHPNNNRWQIVIPSNATTVTFNWYELMSDGKTPNLNSRWLYWENTERGNCTVFNAFDYSNGIWNDNITVTPIMLYDFTPSMSLLELRDNDTKVNVEYSTTDGNGNNLTFQYTMKFQDAYNRWIVNIPSNASTLSFFWGSSEYAIMSSDNADISWINTNRGNNSYYFASFNWDDDGNLFGDGHWNNKLLYLDGSATNIENGVTWVAYFYNDDGYCGWVTLADTTSTGKYIAPAPDWNYVIFCRYNSREKIYFYDWGNVHNQTYDLTIDSNTVYKTYGYDGDGYYMTGDWQ